MGLFLHLLLHSVPELGNHVPSWALVVAIILEPSDNWVQSMSYHVLLFPTVLQTCALLSSALHLHFHCHLLLQLISWLDEDIADLGLKFHLTVVDKCKRFLIWLLALL